MHSFINKTKNLLNHNNFIFFVIYIFISFIIFSRFKGVLLSTSLFSIFFVIFFILIFFFLILRNSISYKDLDQDLKTFIVFIAISSAFITFFQKPAAIFLNDDKIFNLVLLLNYVVRYLSLLSIIGIFYSPAFSILCISCYFLNFTTTEILFEGITKSETDWLPVLEMSMYFILSIFVISLLKKQKYSIRLSNFFTSINPKDILFISLGIHFSNYFFAAIKKLSIGENYLTWISENQTFHLISSRIFLNLNEYFFLDTFSFSKLYNFYSENYILLNSLVLITQIICLFCFFSKKLSLLLLIIYDFFHFMVFIIADIFFYKWMIVNVAFFLVLKKINFPIEKNKKIFFTLIIVIAPYFFFITKLGWFDLNYGHKVDIYAVKENEKEILVPNNYFLSSGFDIKSKIHRIFPKTLELKGLFSKVYAKKNDRYKSCEDITYKKNENYKEIKNKYINTIKKIHYYHLKFPNTNYNLYPHHIYSFKKNKKFEKLDKKEIKYYLLKYKAICNLTLENNKISYNTLIEDAIKVNLN